MREELKTHDGLVVAGMDDTYLCGPNGIVFGLLPKYEQLLAEMWCRLNLSKLKCYIRPAYRDADFLALCAAADIPEGCLPGHDFAARSLKVFGVPIGDDNFVTLWSSDKLGLIERDFDVIRSAFLNSPFVDPSVPWRQCLWQLTLKSLQHYGNYWCRHIIRGVV
jgi:hypothetical protein